ncbi:GTP 3',8-cyclase MoaA [Serinibacter salmoneus]|uniref:GTP 3',8-cyclase n=1 Tax=Serinibacter salmoneus TaxID=556530 RepID=A0A2A9D2U2_9MICO|nr:cyclic pyranopterin phosphate synthase [Serinibacter salmoneus]
MSIGSAPAPLDGVPREPDPRRGAPIVDGHGRVHRDLRISLTDRCSLRCTYCMPEQGNEWLARSSILTTPEIVRIAGVAAEAGISTFRLTGGEPLLRRDVVDVVRGIAALRTPAGEPVQVAMTTNGITLPQFLPALIEAGLSRLNISLDTVHPERFRELTRRDRFDDVMAGIAAARASGLRPLKINTVAMRGVNDDELPDLVAYAISQDAQLRFIEQMPLDTGHTWDRERMVTREEILAALGERWDLEPIPGRGGAPAERWRLTGPGSPAGEHTVGVIASVTAPFCGACDRMRLTADGQLRNCLFARGEYDLVALLRGRQGAGGEAGHDGVDDALIDAQLRACIDAKLPGHGINDPGFLQPDRGMNAIGG